MSKVKRPNNRIISLRDKGRRTPGRLPLLAVTLLLLLGSCFTGVEYTPKVTDRDVRKENIRDAAEDTFLTHIADLPLGEWKPGKLFRVTDDKIRLIFGASASPYDSLGGRELVFKEVREAPSITGSSVTDIVFTLPGNPHEYVYRIMRPLSVVKERQSLSVPFTIQQSLVDSVASLLQGREFYVLTRTWRDDADNSVGGRQFVKVKVDSVTPGNDLYPVKVSFTDERGTSARLFIHPGPKGRTPRSFPALFSFTDPRQRYPQISDEVWELIVKGEVAEDMTRDECRLALGAPNMIDRAADHSYLREVWLYDNGIYLVFMDGVLKRFRH